MNEDKRTLYVVDEKGAVTPEAERIHKIYGVNASMLHHSTAIGEAVSGLRSLAYELSAEKSFEEGGYRFPAETEAKEELLRIAQYLEKLNMRVWAISRTLGTQAQQLAEKIQAKDDQAYSKELEDLLKSDPVGKAV